MQNKVVTTLSRALVRRGHTVVRFNFRGVGKSAGTFAKGQGEQDDLRAVIAWFKGNYSFDQIWLIGFSFGAYVAASVANEAKADLCVSVAPAVDRYDFGSIQRGPYPWWVIQGDQDDVVDPSLVYDWYEILEGAKQLIRIPEAGHYFHGQLIAMRDTFLRMLDESSPPNPKNS